MSHATRLDIGGLKTLAPELYAAMLALGKVAETCGLEKDLIELVKIRASQINGCTFCLQYHINLARQFGVAPAKIDQVAAWKEALIYSERERAALVATERLTMIAGQDVPDEAFAAISAAFPGRELAGLLAAIGAINAWNRFGVMLRFVPPDAA